MRASELDSLRLMVLKLQKEEEEIRELSEDAAEARKAALKQLGAAREAHADQQRAYEDLKMQRNTVNKEKGARKEREKAFEEGERAAKLDGQGELDEEGELLLKQKSNDVQAERVAAEIEREAATNKVSRLRKSSSGCAARRTTPRPLPRRRT